MITIHTQIFHNMIIFCTVNCWSPLPNSLAWGPLTVDYLGLLIQFIHSCLLYLKAVSFTIWGHASHAACIGEIRNAYRILARNLKEKRPLAHPRHNVVNNIKLDLGNKGCDDMEQIPLVQRPMADSSAHSKTSGFHRSQEIY
jgi:hypothetical protein